MNKKILLNLLVPALVLLGLISGGVFWLQKNFYVEDYILMATLILGTAPLAWRIIKDLFRGHFGVDVIAITAIVASFALRQYLAGTVIVLMLSILSSS